MGGEAVVLAVSGLKKRFYGRMVIDSLSFEVRRGEAYLVTGANGAGKSTLLRLIAGLYRRDEGSVSIAGKPWDGTGSCPARIGGFIDEPGFFGELSGEGNLRDAFRYFGLAWDPARARKIASDFGLGIPELRVKVRDYSTGMRKRLAIVRALLFDPVLLLLDEPTSSLDPIGIAAMRDAMATARKRYGTTVVFSSHDLAEAEKSATRAGALRDGSIVAEINLEDRGQMGEWICTFDSGCVSSAIELLSAVAIRPKAVADGVISFRVGDKAPREILRAILDAGLPLREFYERRRSLEEFILATANQAVGSRGRDADCL